MAPSGEKPVESDHDLAQRAGEMVTDHVAALLRQAEARAQREVAEADAVRERADRDAAEIRDSTLQGATEVLERIAAIQDRLGSLVRDLKSTARALPDADPEALNRALERRPAVPDHELPIIADEIDEIAANLRAVMEGPRRVPPRGPSDADAEPDSDHHARDDEAGAGQS